MLLAEPLFYRLLTVFLVSNLKSMRKVIYGPIILLILGSLFFVLKTNKTIAKNNKVHKLPTQTPFYLGTYTNGASEGIYKYAISNEGKLAALGLVAKTKNPSFLSKTANEKYLIAVNEEEAGRVTSFKINKDSLKFISESPSGGAHPCFVTVNKNGEVLVANYTGGNVGLLKLNESGALSELLDVHQHVGKSITERQKAPHAHSVWFHPNSETNISVDLGTDELLFSTIDRKTQKLVPTGQNTLKMPAGSGPRHLTFHPNNDFIYVINELSSAVSLLKKNENNVYYVDATYPTLPKDFNKDNTCADIHISKDGKFLYASNRGHNSIAIFSIEKEGTLKFITHEPTRGEGPRNFAISPDNNFLLVANQYTDNIIAFKRNVTTGTLAYISEIKAPSPVCILF